MSKVGYHPCDRCGAKAFYDSDMYWRLEGLEIATLCATCSESWCWELTKKENQ